LKRVWYKHFPSDWRSDVLLRQVSRAARSFWLDCIGLMYEGNSHRLEIGGEPMSVQQISAALGDNPRTVRKLLAELTDMGVCTVDDDGFVTSRRISREFEKAEKDQTNGRKGGNPALIIKENDKSRVNPPLKAQNQEPEPEEEKKAYAPLAEAKGADEAPADIPSKPKKTPSRGTRLSAEWYLPKAWGDWALDAGASMEMVRLESDVFKDHWLAKSGKDGTKADWLATWRNWIRRAIERNGGTTNGSNSRNSTERSERILGAAAAGTTAKEWG
jgi:DNA-binding transcriptional ArsR family regulator